MFSPHEFNQNGTFGNCLFLQIFRRFSDSFTSRVQIFLAAVASRIPIRSFFTPRVKSASIASVYFWDKVESIPFSLGFLHPGFSFPTLKNLLLPYRPLSTRAHIYIHLLYTTHVLNRVSILLSASWFNYFSFFATFVCVFFCPLFSFFSFLFCLISILPESLRSVGPVSLLRSCEIWGRNLNRGCARQSGCRDLGNRIDKSITTTVMYEWRKRKMVSERVW